MEALSPKGLPSCPFWRYVITAHCMVKLAAPVEVSAKLNPTTLGEDIEGANDETCLC